MTDLSDAHKIEKELKRLLSFVETAQRLIYDEEPVRLVALQDHIAPLCEAFGKLPPQQGRALLPDMEKLLQAVERLEKDIDLQHELVTERLQFTESHANPLLAQEVSDDE